MDIANLIGQNNFVKLQKHFGGNLIWIPKPGNIGTRDPSYFAKRNSLIKYYRAKGLSVRQIADKFAISEKRVYWVLAANNTDQQ